MLNQFENMLLNTFIQKLNAHGVQIDAETVKKSIANSPQIIQQVEEILLTNSPDRFTKIINLIKQTANGTASSTTTDTSQK
jgi:hypothetical protein